jgi:hypothetical protein
LDGLLRGRLPLFLRLFRRFFRNLLRLPLYICALFNRLRVLRTVRRWSVSGFDMRRRGPDMRGPRFDMCRRCFGRRWRGMNRRPASHLREHRPAKDNADDN